MATRAEQFKAEKQRAPKKAGKDNDKPKKAKANVKAKSTKQRDERKRVKPGSAREITAEAIENTPERRFEKKK
jgi:hypothetical protein